MQPDLPDDFFDHFPFPCAIIIADAGRFVVSHINNALAGFIRKQQHEAAGQEVAFLSRIYSDRAGVSVSSIMNDSLDCAFVSGEQHISGYYEDFEEEGLAGGKYWCIQNTPVKKADGTVAYVIHSIRVESNQHKRDTAASEQELKNYRFALDNANVVAITDARGVIQYVNDAFCDISGYTRQELLGRTHNIINSGYHDKAFFRNMWASITAGHVWKGEIRNKTKQGRFYWMDTTIIPFLNDNGHPFRYVSIRREITEQKQMQELLQSSGEKYRSLFNCSPIPMWIYDMETYRFVDVNLAAVRHYGYSREEFLAMTIKDIRPAEDVPAVTRSVEYLRRFDNKYSRNNYRHLKKNGEEIQVRIESNVIVLDGRKACIVLALDITEDERLRREIITANSRLATAQSMANIGHWAHDAETGKLHWSEEVYRIFDTSPDTFVPDPENLQQFFFEAERERFFGMPELLFAGGDVSSAENRIITAQNREKWIHYTMRLIRDGQGRPLRVEGICMDITQRRRDEVALERKNSLLAAINRFTAALLGRGGLTDIVNKAFNVISETVGADRIYFYEKNAGTDAVQLVNQRIEWTRDSGTPVIDNPAMQQLSLRVADLTAGLLPGGCFAAVVSEMPDTGLKAFLQKQQVCSLAALPVFVNDAYYGFIVFENLHSEHRWQQDEIAFLEAATGHLATTIERYNASQELKGSKEQFRSVINNLPGITYRCKNDEHWTMVFISEEAARMTGYEVSGFIDNAVRSFASIIHPDDRRRTQEISKQLNKRLPFELEYRIVGADGNVIWVKDFGRGIYNEKGQLLWIDGVILDVSAHIRQEQQLLESNERFRLVMKASREAIIDWDIENDITVWGDGFQQIFNYDLSVYDNHLWSQNIHPDDKAWVMKALEEALADPLCDTLNLSFRFLKATGETAYVQHRGIFIRNTDGVAIRAIGTMADVTETMMYTRKMEEHNKIFKEISWMQSHLVRAPAARLMALLQLLKDNVAEGSESAGIVHYMEESARELDRIITDIIIKSEHINSKTSNERTLQHHID